MQSNKIYFQNKDGIQLSGNLELPADQKPHNFVLFAHCFTCNKNYHAVRNVSRALATNGFGVFQFDFTGLGESEGDFSQTTFSSNVADLIAAAEYMAEHYQAPTLLVGHSLGGTAAIMAAAKLRSVQAIATIGSPATPQHLTRLFESRLEDIETTGEAVVSIGGRPFKIRKEFVDELVNVTLPKLMEGLRKSILIIHSPQDAVVGISNAAALFEAAHHPKSFISLDGADHLLNTETDSLYAGNLIATWARRYLPTRKKLQLTSTHQVVALLQQDDTFTTTIRAGEHYLTADEPVKMQGNDFGPSPYELVASGLAACTAMTIKMYAARKNWPVEDIEVHITYRKDHAVDTAHQQDADAKIGVFERDVRVTGKLTQAQRDRILEIANKCPVHKTLHQGVVVRSQLVD